MLYACMLAIQLTGALVLLLNSLAGGKKTVIQNCFPSTNFVERDEYNNCRIEKKRLQASAQKIYLNVVAFADMVIGYLLAALNPNATFPICYTVICVIAVTIFLLGTEYGITRLLAQIVFSKDEIIPYSDLEGVDTIITEAETKEMLKELTESE